MKENTIMTERSEEIDTFLSVGLPVILQLAAEKWAPRYASAIRGWQKSTSILVDRPKEGKRLVPIREQQDCIVRYIYEGNAFAFASTVLSCDKMQAAAYCHIAWPQDFDMVPFRRFERVKVHLACKFATVGMVHVGEIRDLSMSGCGVYGTVYVPETTGISVSFALPTGLHFDNLPATTRNVRRDGDGYFLGFEFKEGHEYLRTDLAFFLKLLLRGDERGKEEHLRVLIIDEDESVVAPLRKDFQSRGCEVLVAASPLDGLCRFHLFNPHALMLSQKQRGIEGLELARMVRASDDLGSYPVFVYSLDGGPSAQPAAETYATACFQSTSTPASICNAVISAVPVFDA